MKFAVAGTELLTAVAVSEGHHTQISEADLSQRFHEVRRMKFVVAGTVERQRPEELAVSVEQQAQVLEAHQSQSAIGEEMGAGSRF